ncbi:MAG: ClpXP protease specificity-enhancing factor [Betaproteobacteria bacterium]|nr:ClpXP protease specificity-enhancing factor [Betaproteobacteria bacterium]
MLNALDSSSTRPYLIRALYEWCTDNGFTPYVAVSVDDGVRVPKEFVKNGEIVLNVSFDATSDLRLGNDFIEFKARFGGVAREILVPVDRVMAIYARENGQGMAFPLIAAASDKDASQPLVAIKSEAEKPSRQRPNLTVAHSSAKDNSDARQLLPTPVYPAEEPSPEDPVPPNGGRPSLKRVK